MLLRHEVVKAKLTDMIGYTVTPKEPGRYPGVVVLHAFNQTPDDVEVFARKFAENGFVALAPKYTDASDGVYVAVNALKKIKTLDNVDPIRVGLFGVSLGGTIALLTSTQEKVSFVIDVAGWVDLAHLYYFLSKFEKGTPQRYVADLVKSSIGTPEESKDIYELSSPITYVDRMTGYILIIHGDSDTMVPLEQSQLLLKKLLEKGFTAELHIIRGGGHLLKGKEDEVVNIAIDFLRRNGFLTKPV
ncbi:MAG: hypothetical protein B7O98_01015 [Zestosphaera tikiterensis]|uniref:Peptidase S9 prolyl oligopeptidase catalytic domain-containing protein n=1 Tax=Zestosphaera tikiterensis TaxID=1973259 RepID=A0A2R7Y936_9CREN|nr:MAG: hypothetical protein B7O98_01015 [Zestosphaera tikiterensis]